MRAGFGSAPRELKIPRRLVALAEGSSATAVGLFQGLNLTLQRLPDSVSKTNGPFRLDKYIQLVYNMHIYMCDEGKSNPSEVPQRAPDG